MLITKAFSRHHLVTRTSINIQILFTKALKRKFFLSSLIFIYIWTPLIIMYMLMMMMDKVVSHLFIAQMVMMFWYNFSLSLWMNNLSTRWKRMLLAREICKRGYNGKHMMICKSDKLMILLYPYLIYFYILFVYLLFRTMNKHKIWWWIKCYCLFFHFLLAKKLLGMENLTGINFLTLLSLKNPTHLFHI